MDKTLKEKEDDVKHVWTNVWKYNSVSAKKLLTHRLFIEGYAVFKQYLPQEPFHFLEVGAGSGRYGIAIARDYPQSSIVISDLLPESLDVIKSVTDELLLTNVTLAQEDSLALSYPDNSFDVVFADAVVQHVPNYERSIKEMYRVLKPGGIIIISSVNAHNPPHTLYKWFLKLRGKAYEYGYEHTFSPHELAQEMESVGIKILKKDGFFVAYGLMRWSVPFSKLVGKVLNRIIKGIDTLSHRALTRTFGFEIVCVGTK